MIERRINALSFPHLTTVTARMARHAFAPNPTSIHVGFISHTLCNHRYWKTAAHHLTALRAAVQPEVANRVIRRRSVPLHGMNNVRSSAVASHPLVSLHVRAVFADAATAVGSSSAFERARAEYGTARANDLFAWRNASTWHNFVPRLHELLGQLGPTARFFVAADSEETYVELAREFPGKMLRTERTCARHDRCDDRGCEGLYAALADILSLSRADIMLASGWSSFSEVAAYWGVDDEPDRGVKPLRREFAGRDFGTIRIFSPPPTPPSPPPPPPFKPFDAQPSDTCPTREDVYNTPSEDRWSMWDDPGCHDGCEVLQCGRSAPCCVKRQHVSWPVQCMFLQYGCFQEGSRWHQSGKVVIDTRLKPYNPQPTDTCPNREDVLNTPSEDRWLMWNDPGCHDGCEVVHCGRSAPCCVKRQHVSWPASLTCFRRRFDCFREGSRWHRSGWVVIDRNQTMNTTK